MNDDPLNSPPPPPETPDSAAQEKPPSPPADEEEKEEVDPALLEKALALLKSVARGNGIDPKKITLHSFKGEVLNYEAYHRFKIAPDIAENLVTGRKGADIIAGSEQDMRARITATIENATENPDVIENTMEILQKRKDKGLAIDQHKFLLDRMSKTLSVHEVCTVCSGSSKVACRECKGKGEILCTRCHGSNEMMCMECQGRQFKIGPDGKQTPCQICHGRGKMSCDYCRGRGEIHCPKCKATGKMVCKDCANTGWHSLLVSLRLNAKSEYDYQEEELPEEIIPVLDDLGPALVTEEHAEVVFIDDKERLEELKQQDSKQNEFIVPYHVRLPWGDIVFKIGDKELKGNLFGFQPSLIHMPPFLEKTLASGLRSLSEAANGAGAPALKIRDAARYRAIAETFLTAGRFSRKKAMFLMRKKYPFGITGESIDKMVIYADTALKRATDRPRKIGLAIGLTIVAVFYGLYYIGPVRDMLLPSMPGDGMQKIVDLVMILFGGAITTLSIQMTATKALLQAIGNLLPKDKKKQFLPKAGYSALWGYGCGIVIYFTMIELAAQMGKDIPEWYEQLRNVVGL